MLSDFRQAVRALVRAPGLTLVAAFSLALGIGATTTIFGLANAMLFRPLPVGEPERLVRVVGSSPGQEFLSFSYEEYRYFREQSTTLEDLVADAPTELSFSIDGNAMPGWCQVVSGNYFAALRVPLALGRGFTAEEDQRPAGYPVMVVGHRFWQRNLGGNASAVGKTIKLNGQSFTVVGVAGEGFTGTFPGFLIDVWLPVGMHATVLPRESLEGLDHRFLMLTGRLKTGISEGEALSELRTLAEQLASAHPQTNAGRSVRLVSAAGIHPFFARFVAPFVALLMGMVGLVLLMACANVANLLLARNNRRGADLAVRASLGATRFRILRHLLAESALLGLLGGALGLAFAAWGIAMLERFRPPASVPIGFALRMEWTVLLFALGISLAASLVFGLLPAWRASRPDVMGALRGELAFGGPRGSLLRNALVVAQIAICLVLLVGAGLLGRSMLNVAVADPGFDARGMLAVTFEPQHIGYTAERAQFLYEALRAELQATPGVRGVTYALAVPLSDRGPARHIYIEGKTPPPGRESPLVPNNLVDPGYFEVMRIPIVQGRGFAERDRPGAPLAAVVSQAFGRRYWPGQSPLGKRLQLVNTEIWGQAEAAVEVVGVARDIRYRSWGGAPEPMFYLPLAQHLRADITLHVRTEGDPQRLVAPVRQLVRRLDPELPVASARPMEEMMAFSLVPARVAGVVLAICGGAALLLATTGLFGVVAYSVSRRTREFGIRMALGAQRRDVLRLVVGQGMLLAATGVAIGVAASAGLGQLLHNLLYGVSPFDLVTLCAVATLLAGVALLACYLPARNAVRVDPSVALRFE